MFLEITGVAELLVITARVRELAPAPESLGPLVIFEEFGSVEFILAEGA